MPEQLGQLRSIYLETVSRLSGDDRPDLIVDKNPIHMANLGLIRRLFPNAKLILSLRHPCDAVLSTLMNSFAKGSTMTYFTTVEEISDYYDALFSYWTKLTDGLSQAHVFKYEDLINDLETETRQMLNALDVSWSENIPNYRSANQSVMINTPSYHQVSEPIHTTAMGRWRHYEDLLKPARGLLDPWIERFGYEP